MDTALLIIIIYAALNAVPFFAFAADKRKAVKGRRRISEKRLLALSAAGPFGAAAAMKIFRHKTMKRKFHLVYVFAVVHLIAIVVILLILTGIIRV